MIHIHPKFTLYVVLPTAEPVHVMLYLYPDILKLFYHFHFFRSFPFPQNVVARQERQNHVGGLH